MRGLGVAAFGFWKGGGRGILLTLHGDVPCTSCGCAGRLGATWGGLRMLC